MMTTIENLYADFRTGFENTPEFVIDFYTKNSLLLNNIKTFDNSEELRLFVEITWQYLNAIYQKGRFNDTIDYVNRSLLLIDNEISRLNTPQLKDNWYNGILHFKGMSAYRLKDYKTSTPIYKYLTHVDPKNDNFKNWLNYSSYGKNLWIVRSIYVVCGILFVFEIFFKEEIESYGMKIPLLSIAVLGLIGTWGYESYINRSFKRKEVVK